MRQGPEGGHGCTKLFEVSGSWEMGDETAAEEDDLMEADSVHQKLAIWWR
jgi:hypothetical protein